MNILITNQYYSSLPRVFFPVNSAKFMTKPGQGSKNSHKGGPLSEGFSLNSRGSAPGEVSAPGWR